MRIRVAGLTDDSIVDGPGFRYSVFTQGCPHACPGCHNPQTHDFSGGHDADTGDILKAIAENPLLDGVTLTGGEPFCQCEACAEIARGAKTLGLSVWVYSGFTFEALLEAGEAARGLMETCDVLVDGPFVLAQRSLDLEWRGSRNQRILDLPASLRAGKAVLLSGTGGA